MSTFCPADINVATCIALQHCTGTQRAVLPAPAEQVILVRRCLLLRPASLLLYVLPAARRAISR